MLDRLRKMNALMDFHFKKNLPSLRYVTIVTQNLSQLSPLTYPLRTLPKAFAILYPLPSIMTSQLHNTLCTTNLPFFIIIYISCEQSRDSSVGIALGYGLDDRGSRVRFPAGAGNFSLHHRVQNGSGTHPVSYPMGTRGSFSRDKAAGAWSWPLTCN
jgi:hypothetical protein